MNCGYLEAINPYLCKWTSERGVQNCKESVAILDYTTDEMTYLKANI